MLYTHAQHWAQNSSQSTCVVPALVALSMGTERICFLHPSLLIHTAHRRCVSKLIFSLHPHQFCCFRHTVGPWDQADFIMKVRMECPLFHCSSVLLCSTQGWSALQCSCHWLYKARKWCSECGDSHIHPRSLGVHEWQDLGVRHVC